MALKVTNGNDVGSLGSLINGVLLGIKLRVCGRHDCEFGHFNELMEVTRATLGRGRRGLCRLRLGRRHGGRRGCNAVRKKKEGGILAG